MTRSHNPPSTPPPIGQHVHGLELEPGDSGLTLASRDRGHRRGVSEPGKDAPSRRAKWIGWTLIALVGGGTTLLALIIASPALLLLWPSPRMPGAADLVVDDPAAFVRAARGLIEERAVAAADYTIVTDAQLPAALRVPKLKASWPMNSVRQAIVETVHLDLILVRHRDGHAGARVWAPKHRPHRDETTRFVDIYFFVYSSEAPASPANIW